MAPSWPRPADEAALRLVQRRDLAESLPGKGLCYAALGIAVARWVFKRQSMAITDPITRFRTSGLL